MTRLRRQHVWMRTWLPPGWYPNGWWAGGWCWVDTRTQEVRGTDPEAER